MRRTVLLPTVLAVALSACSGTDTDTGPEVGGTTSRVVSTPAGTDPGSDLGEAAVLVWQPATSVTGVLELSVDAVAEQRRSVFDGWVRDDAMAASRPYFVTVSLRNTGESDLGGFDVPLYLRDDTGALGAPWTLGGDFTACQSGPLPSPFEAGAETEMCLVYLVPDGARIDDMVFEPTEGFDPISWTGEVARPRGNG
ncbi:hypothetical protein SAMN05192575_10332 [Nocardioides alpinus]|uniref:DUF4352 domain-containing protein n=1 Tax=Nocardioides alpinus TaxID=748909 RepID=A0A1I0XXS3_9ACTN|nr:hypothetical protein [Nocardioides alpinus]PKH42841.1 hypothetical protein CXG46_06185 [Nocardioides alpinus]SFB04733.1 hypothetical protein SAMN05192575_10332 [Nocardioides alpinus]